MKFMSSVIAKSQIWGLINKIGNLSVACLNSGLQLILLKIGIFFILFVVSLALKTCSRRDLHSLFITFGYFIRYNLIYYSVDY